MSEREYNKVKIR